MLMDIFYLSVLVASLLCALVAGLLLGFAIVVMPGIARLSDREFLLAFKHMDGIIQNNQPLFMLVWVGSIFAVLSALILGTLKLTGGPLYLVWGASVLYLLTVQLPTIRFNIPLNNQLQALDIEALNGADVVEAREQFETPWNRWNRFRTLNAVVSVVLLLALLLSL